MAGSNSRERVLERNGSSFISLVCISCNTDYQGFCLFFPFSTSTLYSWFGNLNNLSLSCWKQKHSPNCSWEYWLLNFLQVSSLILFQILLCFFLSISCLTKNCSAGTNCFWCIWLWSSWFVQRKEKNCISGKSEDRFSNLPACSILLHGHNSWSCWWATWSWWRIYHGSTVSGARHSPSGNISVTSIRDIKILLMLFCLWYWGTLSPG